ncbi:BRICHOS domain protein [Ancylostoma ceylanicum]|uniref:BRICHOS domain protein n=1 Tax=Ancylostoma ceylanicum TaxID=53326 RepID=A0A0D6LKT2_9BILA|nr:BRICHOS domain protein [Ancylostoma ceylanicum]
MPSSLFVHFYSPNQAHFELRGNQPFKSNSFTAIDFQTGYIAIADHALTDSNGRHTTCFIMPLDRSAISSMDALKEAVSESDSEIQAQFGWQEFWQFDAEQIDSVAANSKFTDKIEDCTNAKWYFLKQAVHSRGKTPGITLFLTLLMEGTLDASCSDCYDFCLPDWAVVRKEKYEDQSTIGIRRLDCFRLYVPEWRNFSKFLVPQLELQSMDRNFLLNTPQILPEWKPTRPAATGNTRWPAKTPNETRTVTGCPGCQPETRSSRDVGGRSTLTRHSQTPCGVRARVRFTLPACFLCFVSLHFLVFLSHQQLPSITAFYPILRNFCSYCIACLTNTFITTCA